MTIPLHKFEVRDMGEAKRRAEYEAKVGEQIAAAQVSQLPPELQQIARMDPGARQAVFNVDLAAGLLQGMANQLCLAGRQDLAVPFVQVAQALVGFRAELLRREASAGIVIARPGDVPGT